MIKMVISPEYFGNNDKKNDIKTQLKTLGAYDINIDNESGFVTALMTQEKYENFVLGLKNRVEETAAGIADRYNGVDYVEYNPDYTKFSVKISNLTKKDRKAIVFDLLMVSATYQVISGIPQSDTSIIVNFYNRDKCLVDCIDTSKIREK